jgi:hypothetical protein
MNFGPAEMAQMMDSAKAFFTVTIVFSVGIGIVLGAIVALSRTAYHSRRHAADRSFQSGVPTVPALPIVPAQEIAATASLSSRSPVPRANNLLRSCDLIFPGIVILIAIAGGVFLSYYSKGLDSEATHNNQLGIQSLPPTIEPQQQVRDATFNQLVIQRLPHTTEPEPQLHETAARVESINANLCEASSRHAIERTLSSAPTKELIKYVEGLKNGSYAFNRTFSGHDAARQLGFGRRFAASYGQVVEEVRARMARKGSVHIDEIIEYLERILREEQTVDRLVGDKDRHFPAVVYLRALQEGECAFPYVLRDTPTTQAMMNHLARAYPDVKRFASEPFAKIYDATVAYGRNQIKQNGSVSFYRLIEEMRRAIVQSANPNVATAPSISSEPASIMPAVPQNKVPQTKSTGSGFFVTQGGTSSRTHMLSAIAQLSLSRAVAGKQASHRSSRLTKMTIWRC